MVEINNDEDFKKFTLFAGWLKAKGLLNEEHPLIPYELAEMFIESINNKYERRSKGKSNRNIQ